MFPWLSVFGYITFTSRSAPLRVSTTTYYCIYPKLTTTTHPQTKPRTSHIASEATQSDHGRGRGPCIRLEPGGTAQAEAAQGIPTRLTTHHILTRSKHSRHTHTTRLIRYIYFKLVMLLNTPPPSRSICSNFSKKSFTVIVYIYKLFTTQSHLLYLYSPQSTIISPPFTPQYKFHH